MLAFVLWLFLIHQPRSSQAVYPQPSNPFKRKLGVSSVPIEVSDWRIIEDAIGENISLGLCAVWKTQDIKNSAFEENSQSLRESITESQNIINTETIEERLAWLEQAIADGQEDIWIYYQAVELAFIVNKAEKAQRYLRMAMLRGWLPENSTLTHYGELCNG
jgi:hypothetical protein